MNKVLEVKNIEKYYGNKSNLTKAIDNISFDVMQGEFVGIMGAYHKIKRKQIKQIQKRRTRIYIPRFQFA